MAQQDAPPPYDYQNALKRRLGIIDELGQDATAQNQSSVNRQKLNADNKRLTQSNTARQQTINSKKNFQFNLPTPNNYTGKWTPNGLAETGAIAGAQAGNTVQSFISAIGNQESGNNYGAVNRSSGALGKYQVMPFNVASWSRDALGRSVSPNQYLQSPEIQEAVAKNKLSQYYQKYGAAGAAVAWYAGEGSANKYVRNNGAGFNAGQGAYPSISSYANSIIKKMGL